MSSPRKLLICFRVHGSCPISEWGQQHVCYVPEIVANNDASTTSSSIRAISRKRWPHVIRPAGAVVKGLKRAPSLPRSSAAFPRG
jgi:hypothetical protein